MESNIVVYPLTVAALAVAVMIGDGCCSFVSISLGTGETIFSLKFHKFYRLSAPSRGIILKINHERGVFYV